MRWSTLLAAGLAALLVAAPAAAQVVAPPNLSSIPGDIEYEVLTTEVADPTMVRVHDDGRVFIAERTGRVKIWHQDGTLVEAGRIGVDSKLGQCNDCAGDVLDEGGLHGLLLARDFDETGHLYLYYSVPNSLGQDPVPAQMPGARGLRNPPTSPEEETEGLFRLSRFTMTGDELDVTSEEILFENPAEWFNCCHYGGDMEWLADGTLLLSTGDDTISSRSNGGYSPRDYRVGMEFNNADLTSQNLADRRGKLLRIDVEDVDGDGSTIPGDNPFLDVEGADPYVYALGFRSNYRFAIDPLSQTTIVGTVGPDALWPDPRYGPAKQDELEVVPPGGGTNHGWPRCIGDNMPYVDWDYQTNTGGGLLSCDGMTPAAIWYSSAPASGTFSCVQDLALQAPDRLTPCVEPWAQLSGVGQAIIGGVTYRYDGDGALALPDRFRDHQVFGEWSRDFLAVVPIAEDGTLDTTPASVQPVALGLSDPIDVNIGPDGAIYVAEYGGALYNGANGKIGRLKCAGCQPDSADYGGAPVAAPGLAPAAVVPLPGDRALGGAAVLFAVLGGVGLLRRRATA